ncbi:hypothetical protein NGRA_1178, partial [Nosema granulosis]
DVRCLMDFFYLNNVEVSNVVSEFIKSYFERVYKYSEEIGNIVEINNVKEENPQPTMLFFFNMSNFCMFTLSNGVIKKTYYKYNDSCHRNDHNWDRIMKQVYKTIKDENKNFKGKIYIILSRKEYVYDEGYIKWGDPRDSLSLIRKYLKKESNGDIDAILLPEAIINYLTKPRSSFISDYNFYDGIMLKVGDKKILTLVNWEIDKLDVLKKEIKENINNCIVEAGKKYLGILHRDRFSKSHNRGLFIFSLLRNFCNNSLDVNKINYHSKLIIDILKFLLNKTDFQFTFEKLISEEIQDNEKCKILSNYVETSYKKLDLKEQNFSIELFNHLINISEGTEEKKISCDNLKLVCHLFGILNCDKEAIVKLLVSDNLVKEWESVKELERYLLKETLDGLKTWIRKFCRYCEADSEQSADENFEAMKVLCLEKSNRVKTNSSILDSESEAYENIKKIIEKGI